MAKIDVHPLRDVETSAENHRTNLIGCSVHAFLSHAFHYSVSQFSAATLSVLYDDDVSLSSSCCRRTDHVTERWES